MENPALSRIKLLLITACGYGLCAMSAQAENVPVSTALYQCPTQLQLDAQSYALAKADVYDGPIEHMAQLKPEPTPDEDNVKPLFWDYGDYGALLDKTTLYLKCHYQNTGHYLVLEMKGARRCTFTEGTQPMVNKHHNKVRFCGLPASPL